MSRQKAPAFLVLLLALWWRNKSHKRAAKRIKYAPMVQRDIWRTSELIRLIDTSERTCMRELRMSRPAFYKLCARLRSKGLLVDTLNVSVEEQLAMFLKIVGQCHTQSSVAFAMWRSEWTVSTYFNAVLRAIVKLGPELIYVRSTCYWLPLWHLQCGDQNGQSFGTWVTDYLGIKYHVTGADDGEYGTSM